MVLTIYETEHRRRFTTMSHETKQCDWLSLEDVQPHIEMSREQADTLWHWLGKELHGLSIRVVDKEVE